MPAETSAEPKALEILESVKAIFASKGFDGASMQDLARAADMSAGNFYRYFPSKNAIIEAIIERELDLVRGEFSEVIEAADPLAAFRGMVRQRIETPDDCEGQIWVEIEAAAARRPEIAALLRADGGRDHPRAGRGLRPDRRPAAGRGRAALLGACPADRHAGAGRLDALCDARRRAKPAARPTSRRTCRAGHRTHPLRNRRAATAPGRPNRIFPDMRIARLDPPRRRRPPASARAPRRAAEPEAGLPAITVTAVARHELVDRVRASGLIEPVERVLVQPQIEGQAIDAILVEVGDRVEAGRRARPPLGRGARAAAQPARREPRQRRGRDRPGRGAARRGRGAARRRRCATATARCGSSEQGAGSQAAADDAASAAATAVARVSVAAQGLNAAAGAARRRRRADRRRRAAAAAHQRRRAGRGRDRRARRADRRDRQHGGRAAVHASIRDGALELRADVAEQDLLQLRPGMDGADHRRRASTRRSTGERPARRADGRHGDPARPRAHRDRRARARARGHVRRRRDPRQRRARRWPRPVSAVAPRGAGARRCCGSRDGVVAQAPIVTGVRDGGLVEIVDGLAEGDTRRHQGRRLRARRRPHQPGAGRAGRRDLELTGDEAMNFSAWSIRNPIAPLLAFFMLMVLGWQSFNTLPITRFPNIDVPLVSVTVTQSRRRAGRARNPGHQGDRGRGRRHHRRQERQLDDHRRLVARPPSSSAWRCRPTRRCRTSRTRSTRSVGDLPGDIEAPIVTRIDVEGQAIMTFAVASADMSIEELSLVRRRHDHPRAAGPARHRPHRPLRRRRPRDPRRARPGAARQLRHHRRRR